MTRFDLPSPCGKHDRAAHHLIRLARIDSQRHVQLDRLVELRERHFLCELNRFVDRIERDS